jgi:hypothetical protein
MQGMDPENGGNMEEKTPRTFFGIICITFYGAGC